MKTKTGKETMEDETISRSDRRRRLPWIKCGNPGDRKIISPEGNRSGRHTGRIPGSCGRGIYPFGRQERFGDSAPWRHHPGDHQIEALLVIGGDGTLSIASKFSTLGLSVVGIPKTIDNNVMATDLTFGFQSAVNYAQEALDRLHTTAESHHRVMILEVMGRNAGWIALHSGVAGGADVILIPEIPYDMDSIVMAIRARVDKGKRFSIVVAAEGAKPKGGEVTIEKIIKGRPEPIKLGGIGARLCGEIETLTGLETRSTVLGHLQRGGSPLTGDRLLSTRFGVSAVEAAIHGQFGQMVALQGNRVTPCAPA